MNVDELQSVRDSERRTDSLQQLRESFYADAGEFISELREERDRAAERADDPFDAPEVDRLTSEIKAAEETVEAIYEKRLGKLVKAASLAAADMPAGTEGMTTEEQQLFETLVEDIRANREHVLDVLAGEQATSSGREEAPSRSGDGEPTAKPTGESVDAADAMGEPASSPSARGTSTDRSDPDGDRATEPADGAGGDSDGSSPGSNERSTTDVDRERVRITADVGPILGVDEREYDLSEDDVVTLPRANAEPLLEDDAAERL